MKNETILTPTLILPRGKVSTLSNPAFLGTEGERTQFLIEVDQGVDLQPYSIFQGEASEAEVLSRCRPLLVSVSSKCPTHRPAMAGRGPGWRVREERRRWRLAFWRKTGPGAGVWSKFAFF